MQLRTFTWALFLVSVGCGHSELGMEGEAKDPSSESGQSLTGSVFLEQAQPETVFLQFSNCESCRGSGTLLSPWVVVTAGHVVNWSEPSNIRVKTGPQPLLDPQPGVPAQSLVVHPSEDLAVLLLSAPLPYAGIPVDAEPTQVGISHWKVKYTGYGPSAWGGNDWGIKRSGWVSKVQFDEPGHFSSAFSFASGGVGATPGDSGGSAYVQRECRPLALAGVIQEGSPISIYVSSVALVGFRTWLQTSIDGLWSGASGKYPREARNASLEPSDCDYFLWYCNFQAGEDANLLSRCQLTHGECLQRASRLAVLPCAEAESHPLTP